MCLLLSKVSAIGRQPLGGSDRRGDTGGLTPPRSPGSFVAVMVNLWVESSQARLRFFPAIEGSRLAWCRSHRNRRSELVRDAICGKLELLDAEDRERPFYRRLLPDQLTALRKVIERLVNSKVWSAPAKDDIDRVLADNKSQVKDWLKNHGLNTGYLMGAPDS